VIGLTELQYHGFLMSDSELCISCPARGTNCECITLMHYRPPVCWVVVLYITTWATVSLWESVVLVQTRQLDILFK
jgi:hypothetical protein